MKEGEGDGRKLSEITVFWGGGGGGREKGEVKEAMYGKDKKNSNQTVDNHVNMRKKGWVARGAIRKSNK